MRRARRNRRKPPKQQKISRISRIADASGHVIAAYWKAALAVPATAAAVLVLLAGARVLLDQPVRTLVVEGTFQRVTPLQVEAALAGAPGQGFFSIDLAALRRSVQALDWVDSVSVRRAWPDTVIVKVTEHQAAARWGEQGLLNVRGELFIERSRHEFPELPRLSGPAGSERQVADVYLAVRSRLAVAQLALESLSLDERGAWHLELAGGQEVRLGRTDLAERLERFFAVAAPALAGELERVTHIDLRYTNGFAVGWVADDEAAPPAGMAQAAETANRG
jgi:cell division protein FtsQ